VESEENMKKEIDFSRGVRGKYIGKNIRIVGDRRRKKIANSKGQTYFFVKHSLVIAEIIAANRDEALHAFLDKFRIARMPRGVVMAVAV